MIKRLIIQTMFNKNKTKIIIMHNWKRGERRPCSFCIISSEIYSLSKYNISEQEVIATLQKMRRLKEITCFITGADTVWWKPTKKRLQEYN